MKWAAMGALLGLLVLASGCSQTKQDVRDDYCVQVKKDSDALTRAADEGGPGAILTVLPTLERLAKKSPADLTDEWQIYLNALHGWRDSLADSGLTPAEVADGVPSGLPQSDRRRVVGAVSVLRGTDVTAASQGIKQHALDVCGTPLL